MGIDKKGQVCAKGRAGKSADDAGKRNFPGDEAFPCKLECRKRRTHCRAHLVCRNRMMNGNPGDHVSRQGNQAAASGNRIDESGQHDQRAYDKVLHQ